MPPREAGWGLMDIYGRYREAVNGGDIAHDEMQQRVVFRLRELAREISPRWCRKPSRLLSRLGLARRGAPPQGMYLWGGVGRGKTFLMDLFFDCLPGSHKTRVHFHAFMQRVHRRLAALQGVQDPLQEVAGEFAEEAGIICFDEFFVSDIGDAMLLGGLLDALFRRKVILVATSNIPPRKLYENGLQRDRFLPAIALLEENCAVIELDSPVDYRLRSLEQATLYHYPVAAGTGDLLLRDFNELATGSARIAAGEAINIQDREIEVRYLTQDVVWFEFSAICEGPRSAADYVQIAKMFHAVIISDVPELNDERLDAARRFVNLIDAFYDCRVKLILSAEVAIPELYTGARLAAEFERTRSRLLEMQSRDYLGLEHRA